MFFLYLQMMPRGRYRYPPARGLSDASIPGVTGGVLPGVQYDMGGMPIRDVALSPTVPVGTLATLLANATPEQQRLVRVSAIARSQLVYSLD